MTPTCTCPSGDGSLIWPCPIHPTAKTITPLCNTCEGAGYVAVNGEGTELVPEPCPDCVRPKPVAWIRADWSGSGERTLSFSGPSDKPSVRDAVANPAWTPLYAAPQPGPVAPRPADIEQAAFEKWVTREAPHGDVGSVQQQWEASTDYDDLYPGRTPVVPMPAQPSDEWVETVIRSVAELPDRNSPEGWPEAMIVTGTELREILASAAPQPAPVAQPSDEQIAKLAWTVGMGPAIVGGDDVVGFARAVLDLRPVAQPPNLACRSVQKRLAAQWGFVPAAQPLTDEQARKLRDQWFEAKADSVSAFLAGLRSGERAHKIGGVS